MNAFLSTSLFFWNTSRMNHSPKIKILLLNKYGNTCFKMPSNYHMVGKCEKSEMLPIGLFFLISTIFLSCFEWV